MSDHLARKNAAERRAGHSLTMDVWLYIFYPLFKPEPHARTMRKDRFERRDITGPVPFPSMTTLDQPLSAFLMCYLFGCSFVGWWLKPSHQDCWGPVSDPNNLETTHVDLIREFQITLGSLATPAEVHYLATFLAFLLHEYSSVHCLWAIHKMSTYENEWQGLLFL